MARHLQRCAGAGIVRAEALPFFSRGINATSDDQQAEQAQEPRGNALWQDPARSLSVVARLTQAKVSVEVADSFLQCQAVVDANRSIFRSQGSAKHLPQIESIIANMQAAGMLATTTTTSGGGGEGSSAVFAEFGAGKAQLSCFVAAVLQGKANGVPFLLIDRASFSNRCERIVANKDGGSDGPAWTRVQIDIGDLDLGAVPQLAGATSLVAFGKHLCGAGADVTLRCIAGAQEKHSRLACSIAIALCCFHRCSWQTYCNRPFLESLSFGREDFPVLCGLSNWATSEIQQPKQREDDDTGTPAMASSADGEEELLRSLTREQRREIGLVSRSLLVMGRVLFLRQRGFDVRLVRYVPETISPENILLLASSRRR
jgi:tRNA:m4X modification enzyme